MRHCISFQDSSIGVRGSGSWNWHRSTIRLQTLEASFHFPSNALRPEIFRSSSLPVGKSAAFCEDVNCVSSSLDRLSDDPLCSFPSIEWGGVYPVNAEVDCCLYGLD